MHFGKKVGAPRDEEWDSRNNGEQTEETPGGCNSLQTLETLSCHFSHSKLGPYLVPTHIRSKWNNLSSLVTLLKCYNLFKK